MGSIFSAPIFFIMFRETTEAAIIVSVLLSFIKQVIVDDPVLYRRLRWHVWIGVLIGLVISLIIGGAFIAIWNSLAKNVFMAHEELWEGTFALIACVMITVMALAMLKSQDMQEKWRGKLSQSMDNMDKKQTLAGRSRKYALMILPMITVLREGLEAMIFLGGVTFDAEPKSIPLAAITGLLAGALLGLIIYRGGSLLALHRFFVASTCFLLLIAGGLFSKAINAYEMDKWNKIVGGDADDAGSYDPRINVWALSYGNPNDPTQGFAAFCNSIVGWNNVASVGTVTGYCVYWLGVIAAVVYLKIKSKRARAAAAANPVFVDEKAAASQVQRTAAAQY
ncbi:high-affinity iron permease [Lobosporangium transversale]|uniref:Iron permease FTR1/Fip1/EfeU n=1 Tax=Lobosporangium transversale TaxID=64571 RepID=A0A1Y2G9L1_9FUNG|nr:iron permease FTR1/Fip1/EfeU [Lobosporangium transversale]KAF9897029.1 high-affinity iron permease [Lobosporangium transversale]ORZ04874.1 iron permease FTR1/Fip1/EfeU [Lobosporangium transversale]|eukprot:XP_021876811.1 iron permease FTR1/Fip1/EfeU [Lobosporangium transversale]